MQAENAMAFKEWAAICHGLNRGEQHVILRKGGIHEGREGFQVDHSEFWLFPTGFHQHGDELNHRGQEWFAALDRPRKDGSESTAADGSITSPPRLPLRNYAVVQSVTHILDEAVIGRLGDLHGWTDETLQQRFHYRQPGLFALTVRIYVQEPAEWIDDEPRFAGCRSWVDLGRALSTGRLSPVVTDAQFAAEQKRIAAALDAST